MWVDEKYSWRCKCPNCTKLIMKQHRGAMDQSWTSYEVVDEVRKCKFCDNTLLDREIMKLGCSHFITNHPHIMYKTIYYEPTGRYEGDKI